LRREALNDRAPRPVRDAAFERLLKRLMTRGENTVLKAPRIRCSTHSACRRHVVPPLILGSWHTIKKHPKTELRTRGIAAIQNHADTRVILIREVGEGGISSGSDKRFELDDFENRIAGAPLSGKAGDKSPRSAKDRDARPP
jgi:hypothetical protein